MPCLWRNFTPVKEAQKSFSTAWRMDPKIHASKLLAREIRDGARDRI